MKNRLFRSLISLLAGVSVLSSLAVAQAAEAAGEKPVRVLIVTGQDYPGHPWPKTTPVVRRQLEQDARFVVRVVEDPHLLDSAALKAYDVVVLHFMNWEAPSPGEAARRNLRDYVEGGGGLVLVHFACGAWQDWPGFVELAGKVWDPKLRGHDPRGPFRVVPTAIDHPITQGMEPFDTDDELYTCLAGDVPVTVLATARSKVDGVDYPMAFVLEPGEGRVFHTVLGHDVKALEPAAVGELLRRGTLWTAGQ